MTHLGDKKLKIVMFLHFPLGPIYFCYFIFISRGKSKFSVLICSWLK